MSPRAAKGRPRSSSPVAAEPAPRAVILAAGAGTRMRCTLPKVLHRGAGRTLIEAALAPPGALSPARVAVVVGAGRERIAESLSGRSVTFVAQDPPLGTGEAARRAVEAPGHSGGAAVILQRA